MPYSIITILVNHGQRFNIVFANTKVSVVSSIWCILILLGNSAIAVSQEELSTYSRITVGNDAAQYSKVAADMQLQRIYIGGAFSGRLTIGQLMVESLGQFDGFICALDEELKPLWLSRFGGPGTDLIKVIKVIPGRGLVAGLICGANSKTFTWYTIGDVVYSGRGNADAVVAMLDASGKIEWSRNDGDINSEQPLSITTLDDGYAVVGEFFKASRFDTNTVRAPRDRAGYLQRLDANGNQVWVRSSLNVQVDTASSSSAFTNVTTDSSGGIEVIASVAGSVVIGSDTVESTDVPSVVMFTTDSQGSIRQPKKSGACSRLTSMWDATEQQQFGGFETTYGDACLNEKPIMLKYFTSPQTVPITVGEIISNNVTDDIKIYDVRFTNNNVISCGAFSEELDLFQTSVRPDIISRGDENLPDGFIIRGTYLTPGMRAIQLGASKNAVVVSSSFTSTGFVSLAHGKGTWDILPDLPEVSQDELVVLSFKDVPSSVSEAESKNYSDALWYVYNIDGALVSPLPLTRNNLDSLSPGLYILRSEREVSLCYVFGTHNIAFSNSSSSTR